MRHKALGQVAGADFVEHVEGVDQPALNGVLVGSEPAVLKHGDTIVLAGTQMQFLQS